jgi:hypothetical protein
MPSARSARAVISATDPIWLYFNYSNRSIVARLKFQGLDQTQAEQISLYIRSLTLDLPAGYTRRHAGRLWNPPHQPALGQDARLEQL